MYDISKLTDETLQEMLLLIVVMADYIDWVRESYHNGGCCPLRNIDDAHMFAALYTHAATLIVNKREV